uniref:HAD family phosphatase n=1 Tax=Parastrongyloides trichosuri TaxID=131310 RepID=A0A0N4ZJV6_PARTI
MVATNNNIKAFIYDLGGVIMTYNDESLSSKVSKLEELFGDKLDDLEQGRFTLEEYLETLDDEHYFKKMASKMGITNDFTKISPQLMVKDDNIEKSIKVLKENGYKIALLTNNFYLDKEKKNPTTIEDLSSFDVVVESCKVGMSKPNENIYQHTLSLLGIEGSEAVFLDDLEANCRGAEKVGIKAIQVLPQKSIDAVREIEKLTGLNIL